MMKKIGDMTMRRDSLIDATMLASIDKQLIQPDEDALLARQVAPPRTGDNPATEVIVYKKLTRDGAAKIFNHVGADNVPLVDQYATKYSQSVFSIVAGYQLTAQEVRAAQMADVPVAANKTATLNQVMAKKENTLFFSGDTPHNMEGLLGYTGIQTYSVPTVDGHTKWADKTAAQILDDIRAVWKKVELQDNYHATMLLLNTATSGALHELIGTNAQRTIYEFIVAQSWFPAGILTSGCIPAGTFVVLQNTRDVIEYALPMDVKRYDPYKVNGFTEELDFEERYGGALIYRPLGVCVATGIA
jgi:hypothetical protein